MGNDQAVHSPAPPTSPTVPSNSTINPQSPSPSPAVCSPPTPTFTSLSTAITSPSMPRLFPRPPPLRPLPPIMIPNNQVNKPKVKRKKSPLFALKNRKNKHKPMLTPITSKIMKNIDDTISNEFEQKQNHLTNIQINDGITTNKVIINIAAEFWNLKFNLLPFEDQLEIGVAIYLSMMVKDVSIKQIFSRNLPQKEKIETLALKVINMMGWLIRSLLRDTVPIKILLRKLGLIHDKVGVKPHHYPSMLASMHETFQYYFPSDYRLQEMYSMDYIFELATSLMLYDNPNAVNISMTPSSNNNEYLKSISSCLASQIGRKYLYGYLRETWCDEIAIYFESMIKFRNQTSDKGRYIIAKNICEVSIHPDSQLAINISYLCRQNILASINTYNTKFFAKEPFTFPVDFFKEVEFGMRKLVLDNHWDKFVRSIKKMNM